MSELPKAQAGVAVAESSSVTSAGDGQGCPKCGKRRVRRSRRRNLNDYLLLLVGLYPYRCHECSYRYHARRQSRRKVWWAQCPKCYSLSVRRIGKDKVPLIGTNLLWRMLAVPAYRCPQCRTRFFDARPRKRITAES